MSIRLPVYNLRFRPYSDALEIAGYTFNRVPNYAEEQSKLHYLVNSHGSEFSTTVQTGGHAHTADVTIPESQLPAVIPWGGESTALSDIILLLRLFTHRDVFVINREALASMDDIALQFDPRTFPWGGVLSCSIPYEHERGPMRGIQMDTSFQVHLPRVYELMQTEEWRRSYRNGYFLVLLSVAIQQRSLESAFTQCWTIWEHLFACLTDHWMSENANRHLNAKEKIAFLLIHFGLRGELHEKEKPRLESLVKTRNRLIHFGQFPVGDAVTADAETFIRMTEYIAARTLGLLPSNVFNTIERLESFLVNEVDRSQRSIFGLTPP